MMNNEPTCPHGFHDTDVMGNKRSNWTGLRLCLIIMQHDDINLRVHCDKGIRPVRILQHAYNVL